jgi:multiple sugar transport system substrate-binding protein
MFASNNANYRRIFISLVTSFLLFNGVGCNSNNLTSKTTQAENQIETLAQQQRFDGITITVATFDKPIGVGVERRAREFEKLTGAKVNMVKLPLKDVFSSMQREFANKTNQ